MQVKQADFYWRVYRSTRTGHYSWLGVRRDSKALSYYEKNRRLGIFWTGRRWSAPLTGSTQKRLDIVNQRFIEWATSL